MHCGRMLTCHLQQASQSNPMAESFPHSLAALQTLRQSQLDHAHIPSITVEELERPSARPPDWPGKAAQHAHSQSAPGPLPADPLQSPPTPSAVPLGPPAAETPPHPLQEPPLQGKQALLSPLALHSRCMSGVQP